MVCITVSSPTSVQSQVRARGGMYNSFVSYLITKSSQRERWYVKQSRLLPHCKVKSEGEVVCITVSSLTSVQSQVRGRGGMYNSFVSYLSAKSSQRERCYV